MRGIRALAAMYGLSSRFYQGLGGAEITPRMHKSIAKLAKLC